MIEMKKGVLKLIGTRMDFCLDIAGIALGLKESGIPEEMIKLFVNAGLDGAVGKAVSKQVVDVKEMIKQAKELGDLEDSDEYEGDISPEASKELKEMLQEIEKDIKDLEGEEDE